MSRSRIPLLALLALAAAAVPRRTVAQDDQPSKGKIDDVERSADDAKKKGDDGGGLVAFIIESPGAFVEGLRVAGRGIVGFFAYVPRGPGQGYLRYPYAEPWGRETFVRRDAVAGRAFGAVSATYFADGESSLRAAHIAVEWAGGWLHREIEFSAYWEPKPGETDHLQMFRLGLAAAPPIGDVGYLTIGGGFQLVTLGTGDAASGPEFDLGIRLFPRRPFAVGAAARVAPLTWRGGPLWGVGFADLSGNGSILLGRFELMAGYRWIRIGVAAPFRGPTLGMRVWW
jgi:hypothetical protein